MRPTFDDRDQAILNEREEAFNNQKGPRVGDFIIRQDGGVARFTHNWGPDHGIQTTLTAGEGSFYLGKGGADYSGGLDHAIPMARIKPTEETKRGHFWFFHHDVRTAHNGVTVWMECRVYEEQGG